jgi:hypothetical protein
MNVLLRIRCGFPLAIEHARVVRLVRAERQRGLWDMEWDRLGPPLREKDGRERIAHLVLLPHFETVNVEAIDSDDGRLLYASRDTKPVSAPSTIDASMNVVRRLASVRDSQSE